MKSNYVDVVVFVILVAELLIGMKSGVILLLFDLLSLIFGWIIAKSFYVNFSIFLQSSTGFKDLIYNWVIRIIKFPENIGNLPATYENITSVLNSLKIPSFLKDFILKGDFSGSNTVFSFISERITIWLLAAISFVILFLAVIIIIRIAGLIIRKAVKVSPFLNWIDVVFGGIVKVLLSIVVISIVFHFLAYIFSFFNINQGSFVSVVLNSRFYELSQKIFPTLMEVINRIISGVLK